MGNLFQLFEVSFGKTVKGTVRSEQPVSNDDMKMGAEPDIILEGLDDHDYARDTAVEAKHRAEEDVEALVRTIAQLRHKLSVVFEIDAKQNRHAEDKLAVRHRVENVTGDIFTKLDHFLGMATRAKPAPFAGESQHMFMHALRISTSHAGKSFPQLTTS